MSHRIGATAFGLLALSVLLQLAIFDRSVVPMDEGHLAAFANWLLEGKRLYRDLHTGIFPGIYYLGALLFGTFGADLIVTRIAALLVNVATGLLLWRIASRVARPPWSLLPPLLHGVLVVVAFPVLTMFNYSLVSMAFALGALLALLRHLERGRTPDAILLGLLIACATLTKQNYGALLLIACSIGLLWGRSLSPLRERSLVALVLPVVAAGGGVALVAALHFLVLGTFGDFLQSTVLQLGGSQLSHFDNPLPPIVGRHPEEPRFFFLYSPPTLFNSLMHGDTYLGLKLTPVIRSASIRLSYGIPIALLCGGALLLGPWLGRAEPARAQALRAVVPFSLLLALGIFPSAIWSHLAFVLAPIVLLTAPLADRLDGALNVGARLTWRMTAAIGVGLLVLWALFLGQGIRGWYPEDLDLPRASLRVSSDQAMQLRDATEFVDRCSEPGEPIFVAPDMPVVYFLTDRPNPTPYDLTIPGNVDGALIVDRLRDGQVRCIVFNPTMYPEFPAFRLLFPRVHRLFEREYRRADPIGPKAYRWWGLIPR